MDKTWPSGWKLQEFLQWLYFLYCSGFSIFEICWSGISVLSFSFSFLDCISGLVLLCLICCLHWWFLRPAFFSISVTSTSLQLKFVCVMSFVLLLVLVVLILSGGGKIESITQIYGLCSLINLRYEQNWINDSVQIRSHYSISLHQTSGKKVFFIYRNFNLSC